MPQRLSLRTRPFSLIYVRRLTVMRPGTLPNRAYYVAIYLCTIELNLETLPSLISLLLKPLRRTGASTEVDNPIAAKVYWNH